MISSRAAFEVTMHEVSKAKIVPIDVETSELGRKERPRASACWDGRIFATGVGLGYTNDTISNEWYYPWRHETHNLQPEWLPEFKEVIESKKEGELVFHNALYDIAALSTLGITVPEYYWDTMVMAHLVNEEFPSKELDWLAKFVLNDPGKDKEELDRWLKVLPWEEIPPQIMAPYCCKDVELTRRLYEVFIRELRKPEKEPSKSKGTR